jgi:TolA-binding protein
MPGGTEFPATLSETLDILPGKSLGEIFLETADIKPPAESWDEAKVRELADRLGKESLPELLKAADQLIARARAAYTPGSDYCNLAHDVHDAIAVSGENPAAAREYILARLNKDFFSSNLNEKAESAKGSIKANWLYATGAALFHGGDRQGCQSSFDRVVKEFPKSPRAEIAMFMSARCAFSATRKTGDDIVSPEEEAEFAKARRIAAAKFETLRKKYPRGRFDADALGWLGALVFDSKDYLKALDYYIAQAESPGHPETLLSAIYNCEKSLAHLAPKPGGDTAFALIARHPRIAMAFTYFVLASPEADNYDGKWDNPADVRKWRRTILPRIAAAVAKQKDSYKSSDWQPRYLAMLVHAASASGNQAQALQLSQISPDQLKQSDDLLFARAIALQRANKTREAIDAFQTFLNTFPKSRMAPGVKIRLALGLQDNHQASEAIAMLRDLLATNTENQSKAKDAEQDKADAAAGTDEQQTSSEEKPDNGKSSENTAVGWGKENPNEWATVRYMYDSEGYPDGEKEWNVADSAVYPNLSGADEEQVNQLIDTLLNFAPLTELATAPDDKNLDEKGKQRVRLILGERYLAAENFAEAKKYINDAHRLEIIGRLEKLTNDTSGTPQEKAERMLQLGGTWAESRGLLLRLPLDTELHNSDPISGLLRRENGHALHFANVEDQLDDRDELHHASRWWMRAARLVPSTPVSAKARLKALEALPAIARVSLYGEQRAREIKLDSVSREIYDKLRAESPNSPEAKRFAAYWSVPPETKPGPDEPPPDITASGPPIVTCDQTAAPMGYPFPDDNAFESLRPKISAEEQRYREWNDIGRRMKNLRGTYDVNEARDLAQVVRKNISSLEDAATANCVDDLVQFLSERNLPSEAARVAYVNLRLDLLHRTHWADSPVDPGISVEDTDDAVAAEIDTAEKDPALSAFRDYLEFCRIGLVAGKQVQENTDIHSAKDLEQPVTYSSRDFEKLEKMTREFLSKYPQSHKREAAMFVLARTVYSLSSPHVLCVGTQIPGAGSDDVVDVVQKTYRKEPFKPDNVMKVLDDYDREFPRGRYAADVRDMRAATLWRMGQWDKALDLTMAQITDQSHQDLTGNAEIRLANIFAELANVDYRPDVLEAIRAHPACISYLALYVGAATDDRGHPLRYLQRYLIDQLHFKIPPSPSEKEVASNLTTSMVPPGCVQ